jgi:four helix bundle protein
MIVMNHKDLDLWKVAIELASDVYKSTSTLPVDERYGLTAQMRGAAVSIASNIAEGAARGTNREFIRFLNIAAGSASELDTQYEILLKLDIMDLNPLEADRSKLDRVPRMIQGLIRSLRQ